MQNKHSANPIIIAITIIAFVALEFIALHALGYQSKNPYDSIFSCIGAALEQITINPFVFAGAIPFTKVLPVTFILLAGCFIGFLIANSNDVMHRHDMTDKEHGSAKFETDFKKYNRENTDDNGHGNRNYIFSKNVRLTMDKRKLKNKNLNVTVIGGSGSGKSRYYVKPNALQMTLNTSYAFTDPSGELLQTLGKPLSDNGYKIKVLDLVSMENTSHFNPIHYIREENDVLILADCIIKNTTDPTKQGGDEFWIQSQKMVFQAYIAFLWKWADKIMVDGEYLKPNLPSVLKMLRLSQINESSSSASNAVDVAFDKLRKLDGGAYKDDFSLRQYDNFKIGAGKTLKSILISAIARLSPFDTDKVAKLTTYDDLELDKIGTEKTALFIILSSSVDSFSFIASMLFTQMFQTQYFYAEKEAVGNYLVCDANGEVTKIFPVNHNIKLKKAKVTSIEVEVDVDSLEDDLDLSDPNKRGWFYKRKQKKIEKKKLRDILPPEEAEQRKKIKENAEEYAKSLSECRLFNKDGSYIIRDKNNDIIGVYGSATLAKQKLEALKNCKVRVSDMCLPYHTRYMLDEFANSVTRSTPKTVGITDKSVA